MPVQHLHGDHAQLQFQLAIIPFLSYLVLFGVRGGFGGWNGGAWTLEWGGAWTR